MSPLRLNLRLWLIGSAVGTLLFALIGFLYFQNPATAFEQRLSVALHELQDRKLPGLNQGMELLSFFGSYGLIGIVAVVAATFAWRRSWPQLTLLLLGVGGAIVLNRLLKVLFELNRPMVGHPEVLELSSGFPSGHTMIATAAYGLLAIMALPQGSAPWRQRWVWLSYGLLIGLIGLSRLYTGVHYINDVLGGYAAGLAWLGACLWLFGTLTGQRLRRPVPGQQGRDAPASQAD